MADVFVSYARSDRETVRRFVEKLNARGFTVWWDSELRPGISFVNEITRELNQASSVVVFWTPASVVSDFVYQEADFAFRKGRLVSVALGAAKPPIGLQRCRIVALTTTTTMDEGANRICKALFDLGVHPGSVRAMVGGESEAYVTPVVTGRENRRLFWFWLIAILITMFLATKIG